MEQYFQIRYEFDRAAIRRAIDNSLAQPGAHYICVADGNILTQVHRDPAYRATVDKALFSICDSSWVPLYLKRIYDIERQQYCGADIFRDLVSSSPYRMAFLGTDEATLSDLRRTISRWTPATANMLYRALPYRQVEDFDYPAIAEELNRHRPDIIWIALGAPKQERFMEQLCPYLKHGIMIGVGAVFNFYSGRIRRAPRWIVRLHLEFLYRLLTEPRKQLRRCSNILLTLPAAYRDECRRSKQRNRHSRAEEA